MREKEEGAVQAEGASDQDADPSRGKGEGGEGRQAEGEHF